MIQTSLSLSLSLTPSHPHTRHLLHIRFLPGSHQPRDHTPTPTPTPTPTISSSSSSSRSLDKTGARLQIPLSRVPGRASCSGYTGEPEKGGHVFLRPRTVGDRNEMLSTRCVGGCVCVCVCVCVHIHNLCFALHSRLSGLKFLCPQCSQFPECLVCNAKLT